MPSSSLYYLDVYDAANALSSASHNSYDHLTIILNLGARQLQTGNLKSYNQIHDKSLLEKEQF